LTALRWATLLIAATALLAFPGTALASTSGKQPFPSNLFTVPDPTQITGIHVSLPQPDCATHPSDCADVAVLDTLDGFNIQPRISIPFSGPIDLSTVSSKTIFLVGPNDHVVGINQVVWEPAANTLHVESDEQLAQDTTYLLVVTRGVHAADGTPLDATTFRHDLNFGQTKDPATKAYRKALLDALPMAMAGGVNPSDIADASLFTTQSITAITDKIRAQLTASTPTFTLGTSGARTVFPLASITSIQWQEQVGTSAFKTTFLPLAALNVFPGAVGAIAFGSYASPDYETSAEVIPPYGTKTGVPVPQSTNNLQFTLFLPAGTEPAGGWPVAIFGHGFTDSKNGAPWAVAGTLAHFGIATIAINVVGHGGGRLGTYTVLRTTGGPVVLPDGGRGIDQDGNGTIDSTEGVSANGAQSLISNRDGLRQTTIDLMELVKVLQKGVDVDGDGSPDLSTSRIYYAGQSFGGIYGTELMGSDPAVRAGVLNVPGGPIIEIARLSPSFRTLVGLSLITRTPSLYNNPFPDKALTNFNENIPLRNLPPVVDIVPGASAIQQLLDNGEWAQQAANPAAYAPHITKPVIFQFARGDMTVPNPTTSAILRACRCRDRATLFRNDRAFAANPAVPKNPHTFLTNIAVPSVALYAIEAQTQLATFLASDGTTTIDPDGPGPIFETPTSMVPEDLAFIP
jgi:Big-like domain-containing protein